MLYMYLLYLRHSYKMSIKEPRLVSLACTTCTATVEFNLSNMTTAAPLQCALSNRSHDHAKLSPG